MFLEIDRIKKHLNIDEYYKDDDSYLVYLYEVAEKVVEKHTDVKLENIAKDNGGELPPPILHAMLLFIGDMYKSRESISFGSVQSIPFSYDYILSLYKNYRSGLV
jgi:hypothetical protein